METSFAVDWLTVTSDMPLIPLPSAFCYPVPECRQFIAGKPHNCYTTAWYNGFGASVMWNEQHADLRVQTQYSGHTLSRYMDAGYSTAEMLRFHMQRKDRLTRLDLAIDVRDSGLDIKEYLDRIETGKADTHRRKARYWREPFGGETLYVGVRQSDKCLRIYDKAAEQGLPGDWVRIELEIKYDVAHELGQRAGHLMERQLVDTGKAMIAGMVDFKTDLWQRITANDTPCEIKVSQKQKSDLRKWLADQVAPAIVKYILKGGDRDIIEQLAVMVNYRLETKSRI